MKRFFFIVFLLPIFANAQSDNRGVRTDAIVRELRNPHGKQVIVVAHRGDWRNAPENSIQAIENVIAMGVDVVEIDVQKTKDGQLILLHDQTLDRTTTGKGGAGDYTLEEIKKLFLRNGAGVATRHRIPTLEEALLCTKDRILVNIDKGYNHFAHCYELMLKTGTLNQVVIKGNVPYAQVLRDNEKVLNSVIYMPIVNLDRRDARAVIAGFQRAKRAVAFEFVFKTDTSAILQDFASIKSAGARVWVNSLWASLNAGHDDDLSVEEKKPEEGWGWILAKGANVIQTDRPRELIAYLKKRGLHR
ncbi:glycerophosphodiester phosphodiesterase [Pedobacter yulinensis]|uniref:Glycerophosphodiester phosphodiesterase n=1 Tax=Pedobacter yulinensis TaxID=2126353 RepID=A0A2T3HI43_9SPHI|nr:glycerophosphodiester phosphodiesterase family protein [Pedobacter yulinensis]PST82051.1 glycerophosphodiester phosphodiesterase [Pedobacter yulinensis]